MDGEVVGIVTAILNPTSAHTFLGIGFAVPMVLVLGIIPLARIFALGAFTDSDESNPSPVA